MFVIYGVVCLLAVACAQSRDEFPEQVLGLLEACVPAPEVEQVRFFSPGGFVLEEGSQLSSVSLGHQSTSGYEGNVELALVSGDEFNGGTGRYDENLGFRELPSTVEGPGTFWVVMLIDTFPQDDTLLFTDLQFTIDDVNYSSPDESELTVSQSGC